MEFDLKPVAEYVRRADTEELLDRVTIYRDGMEPAALDLMDRELERRGVSRAEVVAHWEKRRETAIWRADGSVVRCEKCDRPAVVREWGWHRLFGKVPVFPRPIVACAVHRKPVPPPEPRANPADERPS